mmetsp:Transcript_7372/g.18084  ORF Transcript_7372/g.18084 Transcript_7372/m.18084 type:complete len:208 (+) Transcript_7372:31-654(+)
MGTGKPAGTIHTTDLDSPSMPTTELPVVYLDLAIGERALGRVEILLRRDVCPKTAENFRALCTGEKGKSKSGGKPLRFKGSPFHRIIPGFMAQGGDFAFGTGAGGESIYGKKFKDENFKLKHGKAGIVSMANGGKNSNSSQFFFTLAERPELDGKHVVFGKVWKGMDVVRKLEKQGTPEGKPKSVVVIADCGELDPVTFEEPPEEDE